ncbi:cupin domain-containing protein [Sphingomonas sp. LB-2]|uniref:cupin domain-containing protein n=1 Tax=Sphingomonas caeni TaxID=2984949 RepID=UPI00222EF3E7|nr:cupin domain-containing protein [Sphingomonas caeni]MCW3847686.1 cupin domain-containing protein [Sphingomonas caeni]
MDPNARSGVIRLADAEARIPTPEGERSALVLRRGTLDIRLSIPLPPNEQTPHEQDEIYAVIRGNGVLVHGSERTPFAAGDLLFVAAGVEHHYADFSGDLALWRIFYGAEGGEVPG